MGAAAALSDMMVDDTLTGAPTTELIIEKYKQIEALFPGINMGVYKYGTNNAELREMIPVEKRAKKVILTVEEEGMLDKADPDVPSLKCLGLLYNPDTDKFQFLPQGVPDVEIWTKRKLSSYAA